MTDDITVSLTSKNPPVAVATRAAETAHDSQAGGNSPDQSMEVARERSNFLPLSPPVQPLFHASKGSPRSDEVPTGEPALHPDVRRNSSESGLGMARTPLPATEQPSLGRRIFRAIAGFFTTALIAFLIGILVSPALQSPGDDAKAMIKTWVSSAWQSRGDAQRMVNEAWTSSLDWLMKKLPPDIDIAGKQKGFNPAAQLSTRDAALSASVVQNPVPVAAAVPFDAVQQLKWMAQDLIVIREKLEQITAAQQQMMQKIASLHAFQQDIKQKESSPPSSPAVSVPLRKNAQMVATPRVPRPILRDWWISHARDGHVYVRGHGNIYRVVPGTPLPGLGAVEQIKRQDGRWVVMTPRGIIASMRGPESDDEDMFDGD